MSEEILKNEVVETQYDASQIQVLELSLIHISEPTRPY